METIAVFFAGATTLIEERNQIKTLANDLNAKYSKKGVQVVVYTFEHLGDNQENYNAFIASNADVALCIFKDSTIGVTFEELGQAVEAKKQTGRPEIIVFLHSKNKRSEDKEKLCALLGTNNYYKTYKSAEDLKQKAKEKLIAIIDERLERSSHKKTKLPKWTWGWFVAASILLIGSFCFYMQKQRPVLLLAGGGSVANYIIDSLHVNIDNRNNTLCARMGSSSAWALLAEEVNRKAAENKDLKYIPVCMSAGKADESKFTSVCPAEEISRKIAIIQYKLGEDPLAVYIDSLWYNEIKREIDPTNKGILSSSSFVKLFKTSLDSLDKGYEIFATSVGSGTRNEFGKLLSKNELPMSLIDTTAIKIFHENHRVSSAGKHRLFLGSEFYSPKQLIPKNKPSELKKLYISNTGDEVLSKELYLYFPVYREGAKGKRDEIECSIPRNILELLKDLGIESYPERWEQIIKGGMIDIEAEPKIITSL